MYSIQYTLYIVQCTTYIVYGKLTFDRMRLNKFYIELFSGKRMGDTSNVLNAIIYHNTVMYNIGSTISYDILYIIYYMGMAVG